MCCAARRAASGSTGCGPPRTALTPRVRGVVALHEQLHVERLVADAQVEVQDDDRGRDERCREHRRRSCSRCSGRSPTATVPSPTRRTRLHAGGERDVRAIAASSWAVSTSPSTCMTWFLVSVTERPSAAETPTPSRIRTGTATAKNVSGTSTPTKQKTSPMASLISDEQARTDDREDAGPHGPDRVAGLPMLRSMYASATMPRAHRDDQRRSRARRRPRPRSRPRAARRTSSSRTAGLPCR